MFLRALALTAVVAAVPAFGGAQEDAKAAIEKSFARELPALPAVAFETPGGLKGKAEAKAKPQVESSEGSETVTFDFGAESPLSCTVVKDRMDAATLFRTMVNGLKEKLTVAEIRPVAFAVAAETPLYFVNVVYTVDSPEGKQVGQLKLGIHTHNGRSFACEHDEPGYVKTFQRVVTGFANSLEGGGEDDRPGARFREIHVMRIGVMPVGFLERVVWDRKGGGRVANIWSTLILPRSPTDFVGEDSFSEEVTDSKDLLEEGSFVNVANGEVNARTAITRGKDGVSYQYEGEQEGKKLSGAFKTRAGLVTELWFAKRFDKERGFGPKDEVKAQAYELDVNPVGPIEVAYRKDPARPKGVAFSLGPIRLSGVLDDAGIVSDYEMPVGSATLKHERLFVRGTP